MTNKKYSDRVKHLSKQLLGESSTAIGEGSEYDKFFKSALEKFNVNSPEDLPDEKKDEFFDFVDKNWDAGENEEDLDEADDEGKPDVVDPGQQKIKKLDDGIDPEEKLREMVRKEIAEMLGDDDEC